MLQPWVPPTERKPGRLPGTENFNPVLTWEPIQRTPEEQAVHDEFSRLMRGAVEVQPIARQRLQLQEEPGEPLGLGRPQTIKTQRSTKSKASAKSILAKRKKATQKAVKTPISKQIEQLPEYEDDNFHHSSPQLSGFGNAGQQLIDMTRTASQSPVPMSWIPRQVSVMPMSWKPTV